MIKNRNKIKVVYVGLGLRTLFFLEEIKNNPILELVGLCDLYPSRMDYVKEYYNLGDIPCFTDINQCLTGVKCDAVLIFTPDGTHAEVAIPALQAGKFVFLEKPLEITHEKCQDIIDADIAAGGKTYVGFNLRHAPVYKKIKELIDAGVLGRMLTIQADEFYDGGRTYFRRWNRLREKGGGLWITKACHDFDYIQWLAGAEAEYVSASSALTYYKPKKDAAQYCGDCKLADNCPDAFAWYGVNKLAENVCDYLKSAEKDGMPRLDLCLYNSDKDTFDHGIAIVRFARDIIATYTVNVVAGFTNRTIRISGTEATVDGDLDTREIVIRYRDPSKEERFTVAEVTGGHGGADKFILPDFIAFIRGEKNAKISPCEAYKGVKIGLAARDSADTEKIVHLS
jgi:predicted dehydrogenase